MRVTAKKARPLSVNCLVLTCSKFMSQSLPSIKLSLNDQTLSWLSKLSPVISELLMILHIERQ